ncbi:hypothetical protein COCSADRAFT_347787 [Bipolaris sorokiniana ND90Pr]|uniref:non-specific serine/threonine protein kinase n=1 Tax=Cochliobolus sativus (strain ND90Pr / ATCC 201652) TaxID=665912 RepID=M2QVX8_COCSN|nr:uncharacterized protein COCSADRAFT_347787 [Bipolaris sorokiniana ND90Pr]EMD59249.1 hypothetical protein COCSADRAFT_347787 [Bipolaris sorokiniana ND90Pr]
MALSRTSARPRSIPSRRSLAFIVSWRAPTPLRPLFSTPIQPSQHRNLPTDWPTHSCDVDAEQLHHYCKGGYHPVHLGDSLNNGRYKILHKLGWGGYSTVWAARDTRNQTFVAIKIWVSEPTHNSRELTALRAIVTARSNRPGYQYLMTMQDYFQIHGPNGTHDYIITERLGPSVANFLDGYSGSVRLPGRLAKTIAKQTLSSLSFLHEHKIAHADLHTRNLAFTLPTSHEQDLLQKLGEPETAPVRQTDRQPLEPNQPIYFVRPTAYPINPKTPLYLNQTHRLRPSTLYIPLYYRAPEILFNNTLNHRVDLWSMGCVLFELITGQPPFDTFLITPPILVSQMLEMSGDTLPDCWQKQWYAINSKQLSDDEDRSFQSWLEQDLSKEDIIRVGALVGSMIRLEPSARASVNTVLQDAWFQAS